MSRSNQIEEDAVVVVRIVDVEAAILCINTYSEPVAIGLFLQHLHRIILFSLSTHRVHHHV